MIVASRYAKSLLDFAIEKKQLEAVYADIITIKEICESSHDLQVVLRSPVIVMDKKIEAFKAIFYPHVSKLMQAYLELMARKKRSSILMEITTAFIDQYRQHKNITTAYISSAIKLDAASRNKALEIIKANSKGEVELVESVNPDLIGGFIIRVGDRQIDNSVSRQLQKLKKNFNTKSVSIN